MILNTIVKWVRRLFSVEQLILITGVVLSISILAISFSNQSIIFIWTISFWAFGASGFYTYFLGHLSNHAAKEYLGVAMGVAMSLQSVTQIVSPIFAGLFMSLHAGLPILFSVLLVLLRGAILFFGLRQSLLKSAT